MQRNIEPFWQESVVQEGERSEAKRHTPGLDKLGTRQSLVDNMVVVPGFRCSAL